MIGTAAGVAVIYLFGRPGPTGGRVRIVDLRQQLGMARKWLPLVVAAVVLAAGAAFLFSNAQQRVYESKATLIVGQALQALNPDINQVIVSQQLSTTYATVATKRPALEAVIDELNLTTTPEELARHVSAEAPAGSTLVVITADDTDAVRAAAIANALAERLIESSPGLQGRDRQLQESIEVELKATQEQIQAAQAEFERLAGLDDPQPSDLASMNALQGRLVTLRSTYAALLSASARNAANLLAVIEPAIAARGPISPSVLLTTLLAALVGLFLAAGAVALIEYLDDRVKDSDAIQDLVGLSTLGSVARMNIGAGRPEMYRLATLLYPRSALAESYRTLRSNIEFSSIDAPLGTLLVTSSGPGEGKTVTAANLAVAFAQAGKRTILVDADLRKPGLSSMFGLANEEGLTTLVRIDPATPESVAQVTEQVNLRVITTGPLPPNPAELLGSQRMRMIMELIKSKAEVVIVDSPPVRSVSDAAVLSSYLDGTVLVVDAARSHRGALLHAREALALAGANVIGAFLNRAAESSWSGYGYYHEDPQDEAAVSPTRPVAGQPSRSRRSAGKRSET
jgi:tyrosine-protein kinase